MRLVTAGAIGVGLVLTSVTLSTPAYAAGDIGISDDGVTFGVAYPGSLFDSVAHLVPMDSDAESFFIRNDAGQPAFLRIVLRDVSFSDAAYGAALAVSASTPAETGPATPLSAASPCIVLVEGQILQPDEIVPISAVLSLGDLTGTAGQNATASMTMRVELHDTSTGSLPATTCTTPGTDVPVVLPVRPVGTGGQGGGAGQAAQPQAPVDEPEAEPGELPVDPQGSVTGIEPNTWQLYEERLWFLMLLAFAVGSACFMIMDWVRRRRGLDDETETGA